MVGVSVLRCDSRMQTVRLVSAGPRRLAGASTGLDSANTQRARAVYVLSSQGRPLTSAIVHVRLPLRIEYLPVLRSMAGVVGGVSSLGYDQIMQLRLAVSEAFEFVSRRNPHKTAHADGESARRGWHRSGVQLCDRPGQIGDPNNFSRAHASIEYRSAEDEEILALLNSLMNVVEIDPEKSLVRLVKYTSGPRA